MRGAIHRYLLDALKDVDEFPQGLRIHEGTSQSTSVLRFYLEREPTTGPTRKILIEDGSTGHPDLDYLAGALVDYESGTATFFGIQMDETALVILSGVLARFGIKKALWRDPVTGDIHEHDVK